MNNRIGIIILLAANVVFMAVLIHLSEHNAGPTSPARENPSNLTKTNATSMTVSDSNLRPFTELKGLRWSNLFTNDDRVFIARLRALGCPETTIQDIIIGSINRRFHPRLVALRGGSAPYWETLQRRKPEAQQARAKRAQDLRAVEQQRAHLVQELLGIPLNDYQSAVADIPGRIDGLLADVSETARPLARPVLQKYEPMEDEIIQRANGTLGPVERAQLVELYRQKVIELKSILSPSDLEAFELRASPTAETLRSAELVGFSPTEQEFRQIFRIRQEFDEAYGPQSLANSGADPALVQAARQATDDRLRQALGESRYADYRRSQDFLFRGLVEFADFHGLPLDTAIQVHNLRENVIQQVDALTVDPQIQAPNRPGLLNRIQTSTAQAIEQALGAQVYREYLAAPYGQWVNLISTWTNGVVFGR